MMKILQYLTVLGLLGKQWREQHSSDWRTIFGFHVFFEYYFIMLFRFWRVPSVFCQIRGLAENIYILAENLDILISTYLIHHWAFNSAGFYESMHRFGSWTQVP